MNLERYYDRIRTLQIIDVFIIVMAITSIITIIMLFLTDGLVIKIFLHQDNKDAFMDYFNSMFYSLRRPYTEWNIIYPPFITVIFSLIGNIVAATIPVDLVTAQDLRISQLGMMSFFLPVIVTILMLLIVVKKSLSNHCDKKIVAVSFFILLSAPIIYCIERGNVVLFALLFIILFLMGYRSNNRAIRYLSYVALGLAAGIKIYPLVFSVLIFKERNKVDISVFFLIALTILLVPFVFTDGDLSILLHSIISVTTRSSSGTVVNISIGNLLSNIFTNGSTADRLIISLTPYVYSILCMLVVLFNKKMSQWQAIFLLSSIMIIGPGTSTRYAYSFLIIPLLYMMNEKEIIPLVVCAFSAIILSIIPVTNLDTIYLVLNVKGIIMISVSILLLIHGAVMIVRTYYQRKASDVQVIDDHYS